MAKGESLVPTFVIATLIKTKSDDGLIEMLPQIKVGKTYRVDLDSRRPGLLWNREFQKSHEKEIIDVDNGLWMPTELLEIPNNDGGKDRKEI